MLQTLKALVPDNVNPVADERMSPPAKARHHDESIKYLWGLVHGYTATRACAEAGIPINRPAFWRGVSEQWAELEAMCKAAGNNHIEDHAYKLAVDGIRRGVWHGGKRVGTEKDYDTGLLKSLLAARLPDRHGTSKKVVTVQGKVEYSPSQRVLKQLTKADEEPMVIEGEHERVAG